jgi:hypothetical protein
MNTFLAPPINPRASVDFTTHHENHQMMALILIKASVVSSGQLLQFLPLQHLRGGGGARTLCRSEHERMRKVRKLEAQPWIDDVLPAL